MWFVIGAVFLTIVAAMFINHEYPELFASAMDLFREEAVVEVVEADPEMTEVEIPYDITYTTDSSAVTEGVNGLKRVYSKDLPDEIVREPVNRVVLYPYEEGDVPYGTDYVANPDKPDYTNATYGWQELKTAGVNGSHFGFYDPHTLEHVGYNDALYIPPVNEVISRGSAAVVTYPRATEYTLGSNTRAGSDGWRYKDSKGVNHTLKAPVSKIVNYPSRIVTNIPFQKTEKKDHDKDVGYKAITTKGVDGQSREYYHPVTNQVVKTEVSRKPVTEVTTIGTRKTANVDFGTSYTWDSSKLKAGVVGKKYVYADGRSDHVYQKPVNRVIIYPNAVQDVGFGTTTVYSTSVNAKTTSITTTGKKGTERVYRHPSTNAIVHRVRLTNPVNQIQTKGTGHKIVSGDTLYSLANKYGVAESNLFSWNGYKSGDEFTLKLGLRIRVVPNNW